MEHEAVAMKISSIYAPRHFLQPDAIYFHQFLKIISTLSEMYAILILH